MNRFTDLTPTKPETVFVVTRKHAFGTDVVAVYHKKIDARDQVLIIDDMHGDGAGDLTEVEIR